MLVTLGEVCSCGRELCWRQLGLKPHKLFLLHVLWSVRILFEETSYIETEMRKFNFTNQTDPIIQGFWTFWSPVVIFCTSRFDNKKFYVLPTQCIFALCIQRNQNEQWFLHHTASHMLVLITDKVCVHRAVRADSLNIIEVGPHLQKYLWGQIWNFEHISAREVSIIILIWAEDHITDSSALFFSILTLDVTICHTALKLVAYFAVRCWKNFVTWKVLMYFFPVNKTLAT